MNDANTPEELARRVRSIAGARTVPDVFKSVLEACRGIVPRASVFLVRKDSIQGWGSFGYGMDVARAQRAYRVARDEGWLGRVLLDGGDGPIARTAEDEAVNFGQSEAEEATALPLRIDGRAVALVVAERGAGESTWMPGALSLLSAVAEMRLELDLARRRAGVAEQPQAPPAAEQPEAPAEGEPEVELKVETGAAAEEKAESAEEASPELETARRYARLVATDIRLYNEEDVQLGRRNGDLAERLGEHLGRGRQTFMERHPDLGPTGIEVLHEAYVQVLAGGDSSLIPATVLEQ